MLDHVSHWIELSKSKVMMATKRTRVSPVLFALRLATALYFAMALMLSCCLFLPARAEGDDNESAKQSENVTAKQSAEQKTNRKRSFYPDPCSGPAWLVNKDKWTIAKTNVDKFFDMEENTIAHLFGCRDDDTLDGEIELDEKLAVRIFKYKDTNEFSFRPKIEHPGYTLFGQDDDSEHPRVRSETVWTGAKRKDEKEYWSIIKANLDKFIGMSSEKIIALLGPERCSSKPWNRIDYRVGDAGLTFFLKDGKVEKFRFSSDRYIPGT